MGSSLGGVNGSGGGGRMKGNLLMLKGRGIAVDVGANDGEADKGAVTDAGVGTLWGKGR